MATIFGISMTQEKIVMCGHTSMHSLGWSSWFT